MTPNLGLITLKQASDLFPDKPCEATIRTWKRREDLPPFIFKKIGGTVYVILNKLVEWIENPTQDAA